MFIRVQLEAFHKTSPTLGWIRLALEHCLAVLHDIHLMTPLFLSIRQQQNPIENATARLAEDGKWRFSTDRAHHWMAAVGGNVVARACRGVRGGARDVHHGVWEDRPRHVRRYGLSDIVDRCACIWNCDLIGGLGAVQDKIAMEGFRRATPLGHTEPRR